MFDFESLNEEIRQAVRASRQARALEASGIKVPEASVWYDMRTDAERAADERLAEATAAGLDDSWHEED